eukprot:TRINITY_DN11364_c0_g1_i1.p1 TRINITY_DN11364_c0_g1~~TRINITY_DN11364_c0_g1_i1.p1  ORF type:complete len:1241 (-),score=218.62 TRINITY_DN11364_c0_g1_i1:63-3785(-)
MLPVVSPTEKLTDEVEHKSVFKVVIKDLEAIGLPKPDLIQKAKVGLEVKVAGNTFTTIEKKKDLDPKWNDSFSLDLDSTVCPLTSQEKLVVEVLDHNRGSLGYVMLDLPSVFTGPKHNKLTLRKKKRKCEPTSSDPVAKGTAQFTVDVSCTAKSTIVIKGISFDRLKPSLTPNRLFPHYQNDVFMEYFLESQPNTKYKTSVCYNTMSPTWEQCRIPFEGTLQDILSQVVILRVFHTTSSNDEELGECKIPVKSYYSFTGESVPFVCALNIQDVPFGEVRAFLELRNLPCCSQLEGGYRNDEGIIDGQPLIEECPKPQLPSGLRVDLKAPLFSKQTPKHHKTAKVDLPNQEELQGSLKSLLEKLKSKTSSSVIDELTSIIKKDPKTSEFIFRDQDMFNDLMEVLADSLDSKSSRKGLFYALSMIVSVKNADLTLLRKEETMTMLLHQLGGIKDDATLKHLTNILEPLSIVDSNCQALFRKEESIHYLLKIMDTTKDLSTTCQIIQILGNLCYGIGGGGSPHNSDVIRQCGGIKKILKSLSTKLSHSQVEIVMKSIAALSWENEENGMEIVATLVSMLHTKDEGYTLLVLQFLDSVLSNTFTLPSASPCESPSPTKTTSMTKTTSLNTTTATRCTSLPNLSSLNPTPLSRLFIDSASVTLINLQVTSSDKELISLAQSLLRRYSYAGAEEKLLGELIQELWSPNASSQHMAIDTMALWTKKSPASTKPLEEAVKTKNALEPLIQAVKKSVITSPRRKSSANTSKLLLSSLQLIKRVTADSTIASILFDIEEQTFLDLIIDFVQHTNPKIQKCALELLNNLTTDIRADSVLSKSSLLEKLVSLVSSTSTTVPLKVQCLKLILHQITFADVERKKQFSSLKGVREVRKLLSSDTQLALLSVKILHTICFPAVSEIDSVINEIVKCSVIPLLVTLLSNPMLITPPAPPHSLVAEILIVLKDFWSVDAIKSSTDIPALVSVVWKTYLACYYCDVAQIAAECLKTWNTIAPCSVVEFGTKPIAQLFAECRTCSLTGEEAVCWACIETCHKGHQINIPVPHRRKMFSCHCGGAGGVCHSLEPTPVDQAKPVSTCTFAFIGRNPKSQPAYQCSTCFSAPGKFICEACFKSSCHAGHLAVFKGMQVMTCACGDRMTGCALLKACHSETQDDKGKNSETPTADSEPHHGSIDNKIDEVDMDCIVCMAAKKDTIFYKCGHLACCYDCAQLMKGKDCPICRSDILDVCRVYYV